ncbi:MAG: rRNA maturation RNase YbeY [Proteobacteria bacterium]|nr:rRNA maturation RNase YbeY [Pseudomonadota bacterium]
MTSLPFDIELAIAVKDNSWRDLLPNLETCTKEVIEATLSALQEEFGTLPIAGEIQPVVEISLVLTGDKEIRELNRDYREKNRPTNVLSFPDTLIDEDALKEAALTEEPLMFGDIIMASDTIREEADAQHKSIADHFRHLLVHGVLHLAGHDHIDENEAQIMEQLEIDILRGLGIPNPYEIPDNQCEESPLTR